jgi:hypothetical protein
VTAKRSHLLAFLTTAAFAVLGYLFLERLGQLWRFDTPNLQIGGRGRIDSAMRLLEIAIAKGPITLLFGLGNSSSWHYVGGYPHIVPLEVLAEEGLFGLFLFLTFMAGVYGTLIAYIQNKSYPFRSEACLFAALFTFETLLCLKQGSLIGNQPLFCFGFCALLTLNSLNKKYYFVGGFDRSTLPPRPVTNHLRI